MFETFSGANQVPDERKAYVLFTNQSPYIYNELAFSAGQRITHRGKQNVDE